LAVKENTRCVKKIFPATDAALRSACSEFGHLFNTSPADSHKLQDFFDELATFPLHHQAARPVAAKVCENHAKKKSSCET